MIHRRALLACASLVALPSIVQSIPLQSWSAIDQSSSTASVSYNTSSTSSTKATTTLSSTSTAVAGADAATCTNKNVIPTDLPTASNWSIPELHIQYNVTDIGGLYQYGDNRSAYSLGGLVFGDENKGVDSNSWTYCIDQCADWCDSHANCQSFNVFTFEEADYPQNPCVPTCECRAVSRHFDKADYQVQDPFLGIKLPSYVFDKESYCFTDTCCYNPNAYAQDPCLWEAAQIPDFITNYYKGKKANYNIIKDIQWDYFKWDYDCDVTDIVSCATSYGKAGYLDPPDKIRVHQYNKDVFSEAIAAIPGNNGDGIVSQFVQNTKPIPKDNSQISTGFTVAAAAVGIVASVTTDGLSQGLWVFSELLGLGSLGDYSQQYPAPSVDVFDLGGYLQKISDGITSASEHSALQVKQNVTFAVEALAKYNGYAMNETDGAIWVTPTDAKTFSERIIHEWSISQLLRNAGIFVHWEKTDQPGSPNLTSLNCPGQTNIDIEGNHYWTYPVFYQINAGPTPHAVREYDSITNLANWNLTWSQIALASGECQSSRFDSANQKFGKIDTKADDSGLAAAIAGKEGSFDSTQILCFWDLPVCAGTDLYLVDQCQADQCQCLAHAGDHKGYNNRDEDSLNFRGPDDSGEWWNTGTYADNFAFDDWCAGKLGLPTLAGSPNWPMGDSSSTYSFPFGKHYPGDTEHATIENNCY